MTANVSDAQIIQAYGISTKLSSAYSYLTGTVKSGIEAYIYGQGSALSSTISRVGISAVQWIKSKLGVSYGEYGQREDTLTGTSIKPGRGGFNELFAQMLNKHAKKLGLQSDLAFKIEETEIIISSLDSAIVPFSFRVNCNAFLGYEREVLERIVEAIPDPNFKRALKIFIQSPQYSEMVSFFAAQMTSHIKMNTNTLFFVADVISFYLSKALIGYVAKANEMDSNSLPFIIITGYLSQLLPFMLKALISRRNTYEADRQAVELTENPQAAMEAFQIFEKQIEAISKVERLFSSVQRAYLPSYQDRISALRLIYEDAFQEIETPALEELQLTTTMRTNLLKEPLVNFILQVLDPRNKLVAINFAKESLPSLAYFMYSAYVVADMDMNQVGFWYGLVPLFFILQANLIEESCNLLFMGGDFIGGDILRLLITNSQKAPERDATQQLIDRMAKDMGVNKSIELRYFTDETSGPNSSGCSWGPGTAVIRLPRSSREMDPNMLEFIVAHEITHIKKNHLIYRELSSLGMMIFSKILFTYFGNNSEDFAPLLMQGLSIKIVTLVGSIFLDRFQEDEADRAAGEENMRAIGGRDYFNGIMKEHIEIRSDPMLPPISKIFFKVRFSSIGNDRFDLEHYPLSERIRVLEEDEDK